MNIVIDEMDRTLVWGVICMHDAATLENFEGVVKTIGAGGHSVGIGPRCKGSWSVAHIINRRCQGTVSGWTLHARIAGAVICIKTGVAHDDTTCLQLVSIHAPLTVSHDIEEVDEVLYRFGELQRGKTCMRIVAMDAGAELLNRRADRKKLLEDRDGQDCDDAQAAANCKNDEADVVDGQANYDADYEENEDHKEDAQQAIRRKKDDPAQEIVRAHMAGMCMGAMNATPSRWSTCTGTTTTATKTTTSTNVESTTASATGTRQQQRRALQRRTGGRGSATCSAPRRTSASIISGWIPGPHQDARMGRSTCLRWRRATIASWDSTSTSPKANGMRGSV